MDNKTALEWTQDILRITAEIKNKHPELLKFVDEMPVTLDADGTPDNDPQLMKAHYETLESILKKYDATHESNADKSII